MDPDLKQEARNLMSLFSPYLTQAHIEKVPTPGQSEAYYLFHFGSTAEKRKLENLYSANKSSKATHILLADNLYRYPFTAFY